MNGTNGHHPPLSNRAQELLDLVKDNVTTWIDAADQPLASSSFASTLVEHHPPAELKRLLNLSALENSDGLVKQSRLQGKEALGESIQKILKYSVNTWHQGFMDKLYAATNPVGLASELLLAALNTNVHVYQVSPVLSLIEKHTTEALARQFGYTEEYAGGISQPGGSASNSSSVIIARNTLHPETKEEGLQGKRYTIFTSAHSHYSLDKAAQIHGFGSKAVKSVPVDKQGCMIVQQLRSMIEESLKQGEIPFYVNATAGTTVLGSYDPISDIADVCEEYKLWLHVDACWGGSVVFSPELRKERLRGVERADSIAFNPHKMLAVPMTCSFLLGKDMRQFWKAMTLPAGYLFHSDAEESPDPRNLYDLADITPQCGRRGDALKFYLSWQYHGTSGLRSLVEGAFSVAEYMLSLVDASPHLIRVSPHPLPCTQVCFYYARDGKALGEQDTSRVTQKIANGLIERGHMIDYAPGPNGKMLRAVVGVYTEKETVKRLVENVEDLGHSVSGP